MLQHQVLFTFAKLVWVGIYHLSYRHGVNYGGMGYVFLTCFDMGMGDNILSPFILVNVVEFYYGLLS